MTIPGVGMIAAMELLLELQDVTRFQRADQLAAYVGLTPSQYSSADKIRMRRMLLDNNPYVVGLVATN
jgi:transposase